jgi:hypothetical protein
MMILTLRTFLVFCSIIPDSSPNPPYGVFSTYQLRCNPHGYWDLSGGEGEIRTLERLPVTRFPGVRLRPLGHLTFSIISERHFFRFINIEAHTIRI